MAGYLFPDFHEKLFRAAPRRRAVGSSPEATNAKEKDPGPSGDAALRARQLARLFDPRDEWVHGPLRGLVLTGGVRRTGPRR